MFTALTLVLLNFFALGTYASEIAYPQLRATLPEQAPTHAIDLEIDRRVSHLWRRAPGAKDTHWTQARLEIDRILATLNPAPELVDPLRDRLNQLARDTASLPAPAYRAALRLDAELLARTVERLVEDTVREDRDERTHAAAKIIAHAYVLIGRGDAFILRRWAVWLCGRDYDVKNHALFWREVGRNLSVSKIGRDILGLRDNPEGDDTEDEDPDVIASRVREVLTAQGSLDQACARLLED